MYRVKIARHNLACVCGITKLSEGVSKSIGNKGKEIWKYKIWKV